MLPSLSAEDVLQAIRSRNLLGDARVTASGGEVEGNLSLGDRSVGVRLAFPSTLKLPTIWLDPPDALGLLPHLDREICYQDKEGLVLNRRDPAGILEYAIERARDVLLAGLRDRNKEDFAAEFATIWERHQFAQPIDSMLEPGGVARMVVVISTKGGARIVADDEEAIRGFFGRTKLSSKRTLRRGVFLPLRPGAVVVPPAPRGAMWSARDARQKLLPHLTEDDRRRFAELVRGKPNEVEYVFFSLPTNRGGHSLFGIRFVGSGDAHPLIPGGDASATIPLRLRRLDSSFLVPRGGAAAVLMSKSVLLVGCGAVGGLVAQSVARSGIGSLDLVDPDEVSEENSYRHLLGREFWGKNKAEAMRDHLRRNIPYLQVESFSVPVESLLNQASFNLARYDLVIVAIGDPTIEMHLNDFLKQLSEPPLTVYTWVEPLGVGGHVLLTGTNQGGGCFECSLTSLQDEGEDLALDRLSFAAPGQEFGRDLAGCGTLHTPYSFQDAVRTATLAVDRGISAVLGREPHNLVESWKGSGREFRAEGFKTSPRFQLSPEQLAAQRRWERNPRCRSCEGAAIR